MPQKRKLQQACEVLGESSLNSVPANVVLVRLGLAKTTVLSKANKARLAKLAADKQARLAEQAEQARLAEQAKDASLRAFQDELVAAMRSIEQAEQAEQAAIDKFFKQVAEEKAAAESDAEALVAAEQVAKEYLQFQALCMGGE